MTGTIRYRIERQGFTGFDDAAIAQLNVGLRFAPAICSLLTLATTLEGNALGLLALAPAGLVGVITGRHPFDAVYDYGFRYLWGHPRTMPAARAPRRFAFAVASTWLTVAGGLLALGATTLGLAFGFAFSAVTMLAAVTNACPACPVYRRFARLARPITRDLLPNA